MGIATKPLNEEEIKELETTAAPTAEEAAGETEVPLTEERVRELAKEVFDDPNKAKLTPKQEEIEAAFLTLSLIPQTERAFEVKLTEYATKWHDNVIKGDVKNMVDQIKKTDATDEEKKLAFIAFCVLENYARRHENLTELSETLSAYENYFEGQTFLIHLEVCNNIKKLEAFDKAAWSALRLNGVLQKARENKEKLTGNVGADHAFAETVLLAFENAEFLLDKIPDLNKQNLLQEALDVMVDVHVKDRDYAKFYCTHGRLLALVDNFEDALSKLNKAIDKEDNTKGDYPIRIGRYLAFIQQVRALQQKKKAEAQLNDITRLLEEKSQELQNLSREMEQQSKESTTKSMEFLGLFSGIVSFTIGSLTITGAIADQSIKNAAGLIVILMGALIGVYASFGIILHGVFNKKAGRNLAVLALGIGIVVGGILLCLK